MTIPEGARPPEGMCRVWLPDVPERQQPAPTDCASALRTRPRNAILLFGDLSREAKQPPRRESTPVRPSLFDDVILRRSNLRSTQRAGDARQGTMTPTQAAEAAARANAGATAAEKADPAAVKAEASKATVKRPPPQ